AAREERPLSRALALLSVLLTAGVAEAGGSNYGIAPGARPKVEGRISEWKVPTPQFARDPAPGPDGNIYIAVMAGNKIARFDTRAKTFTEWDLPPGTRPHGLLVDRTGRVWYTGNGNGTIGELDPKTGTVVPHRMPSGGDPRPPVRDRARPCRQRVVLRDRRRSPRPARPQDGHDHGGGARARRAAPPHGAGARRLALGDALWTRQARARRPGGAENREGVHAGGRRGAGRRGRGQDAGPLQRGGDLLRDRQRLRSSRRAAR